MATAAIIPELEYLHTTYEPDCDFIDGVLAERNAGEGLHSELQALLTRLLGNRERLWSMRVKTEWRVKVAPHRYRIPDVCLVPRIYPREGVLDAVPVLCIEVLSPEDRISRLRSRLNDFFQMGVENIWVLDPESRTGYQASRFGLLEPEDGVLRVKDSPVELVLSDLWAEFDAE